MASAVVPAVGLSVLVDPEAASLDIVFVHGFTGHPERTWTHKNGSLDDSQDVDDSPPQKARKLNPFSRPHQAVYWPKDLLAKSFSQARVLTFGYDTNIRHMVSAPISRNTVYGIAGDFMVALEAERRSNDSRPVIFIAHSLGGIVVKEMLRRASRAGPDRFRKIYESTSGIMFFGTPHGGADPLGFSKSIIKNIAKGFGFRVNDQIVDTLMPTSERLMELRDEFGPMAEDEKWNIHSFQEQYGITGLNGNKVVEDNSSCLNLPRVETRQHIESDHMGMCRFIGPNDMEYRKVVAALQRMILEMTPSNDREIPVLDGQDITALLESLRFEQIYARQMTIKKAYRQTCKWFLRTIEYVSWLEDAKYPTHHGFLWIKGNPGTGKSTLMKFIFANSRRAMRNKVVLSFFFNARGDDLEKSTIGMYRSMLLQLLEKLPELQKVIDHSLWRTKSSNLWSLELLEEIFEQAIQGLGQRSVVCFIDALDECPRGEIRRMISLFEHLGDIAFSAGTEFRICFSSRHYPHITVATGLSVVLEQHDGHKEDIISYVNSELKIGHNEVAEEIRTELQGKSKGVFMWVVLVVDILNDGYDDGREDTLQQKLKDIPGDLHRLFHDIITRDSDHKDRLALCIQWILFAKRPLTPTELYFAIRSNGNLDEVQSCHSNKVTHDGVTKFILHCSKGLAEVTNSKSPTVQFIHESVRDFFIKDNGHAALGDSFIHNFIGQSHEKLKQCCATYLRMDISYGIDISGRKPIELENVSSLEAKATREAAQNSFPFLEYAVRNVLYHADAAEGDGIDQDNFMHQEFQRSGWIALNNVFEKHMIRRKTNRASLLYIFAESNLPNLIKPRLDKFFYLQVEGERYGTPLLAALANNSNEALLRMLRIEMEGQNLPPSLCDIYGRLKSSKTILVGKRGMSRDFIFSASKGIMNYFIQNGEVELIDFLLQAGIMERNPEMSFNGMLILAVKMQQMATIDLLHRKYGISLHLPDSEGRTPLSWASSAGSTSIVEYLLSIDQIQIDIKDKELRTPLSHAAEYGHVDIVKLLLSKDQVNVDAKDKLLQTPLSWAVWKRQVSVVEFLLSTGQVDVNAQNELQQTPLVYAVETGQVNMVKLLLATGAVDVNLVDIYGQTPLIYVARNGKPEMIKLLLQQDQIEVDLEARDKWKRTALHYAVVNGKVNMVKLLLATGAVDINSVDIAGQTPLIFAARTGNPEMIKLLLERDQIDFSRGTKEGFTALSGALNTGQEGPIRLLIDTGHFDVNSKDKDGWPLLALAAFNNWINVTESLLRGSQLDVNGTTSYGVTPFMLACKRGNEHIAELLLKTGKVDVEAKDKGGRTALTYAVEERHVPIIEMLRVWKY